MEPSKIENVLKRPSQANPVVSSSKVAAQNHSLPEESLQSKSKEDSIRNELEESESSPSSVSKSSHRQPITDEVRVTEEEESEPEIPEESKISKTLSDKTIKTVVMLVLLLLFMLAVCSSEAYVDSDIMHVQGLKNLRDVYDRGAPFYKDYRVAYEHYINRTTSPDIVYKLVFLSAPDPYASDFINSQINLTTEWEPKLTELRKDEYASVLEPSVISNNIQFIASYSTKEYSEVEAQINLFRTSFIVIVLGLASIYFTKDA